MGVMVMPQEVLSLSFAFSVPVKYVVKQTSLKMKFLGLKLQLLSGSSVCQPTLKILDLPSLHNHRSQFLKVSLSPCIYK